MVYRGAASSIFICRAFTSGSAGERRVRNRTAQVMGQWLDDQLALTAREIRGFGE